MDQFQPDARHLEILRQGVKSWNQWRYRNRGVTPVLNGANLSGMDLSQVNLQGAHLEGAILKGANLQLANLVGAQLPLSDVSHARFDRAHCVDTNMSSVFAEYAAFEKTTLTGANLGMAELKHANLSEADASNASFNNAYLEYSNLRRANLLASDFTGTKFIKTDLRDTELSLTKFHGSEIDCPDLSGAKMSTVQFIFLDLSSVIGLARIQHSGPSFIDVRTLQDSGTLPLPFLRGCGLPESLIDYLPSLLNQAIEFYSCFLSYSSTDDEFARRLHADLQDNGIRCWFAPEDLKIGARIRYQIDDVIRLHEKLLLVLSRSSINSEWVEKEVETAMERERDGKKTILFPIRLDDAVFKCKSGWAADIKRTRHIGDFREWRDHTNYRAALKRLLRDLAV